jgi:hypothetical protein
MMAGEGRFVPCKCVIGHGLDEEGCRRVTYVVHNWLLYSFGNMFSD